MLYSIASMVVFNDSFDHLLLGFIANTLFVFYGLCVIMFDLTWRGTFSLSTTCWSTTLLHILWRTLNIMMLLIFLDPTSKSLMVCVQTPQLVFPYISYV
jgi:hypothetical protein